MYVAHQINKKLFLINKNFDWRKTASRTTVNNGSFFVQTIQKMYPHDKSYNMKENNSFHKPILDEPTSMISIILSL